MSSKIKGFVDPLRIQYQILKALVIREVLTRWGRKNIAFLWFFLEPTMMVIGNELFWLIKTTKSIDVYTQLNISLTAFVLIGYLSLMLVRNSINLLSQAIRSNSALLQHRSLKPLDFYFSRFILEVAGASTSLIILLFFLISLTIIPPIKNPPLMLLAWYFFIWLSLGVGLTLGPLIARSEALSALWRSTLVHLLFLINGSFFFVAWLPDQYQKIVLWIPMVHISEMLKNGYYGQIYQSSYYSIPYIITWCILLTFSGLLIARYFGKHLPERI